MDGTVIGQGSFIVPSTVVNQVIAIPSGVDWLKIYNYTQFGTAGTGTTYNGIEYYWQRGMAVGTGIVDFYLTSMTTAVSGDTLVSGGFTLYDPTGQTPGSQPVIGSPVAVTAVTNATRPVASTGSTAGVSVGTVVRLSQTAQTDVNGIDMVVGAVSAGATITLLTATNALATAPGAIGGAGFYSIVNTNPLFYPARRFITKITQATNAQVSTSVEHNLTPGQEVRFNIPAVSGMTQLNGNTGNNYQPAIIVSIVDAYNFTININTTSFTAFTFPTIAQQPSSFPTVTPFGIDTATALSTNAAEVPTQGGLQIYNTNTGYLADATVNTGFIGMILGTGGLGVANSALTITGPAGSTAGDVVYWVAGKSTYGGY